MHQKKNESFIITPKQEKSKYLEIKRLEKMDKACGENCGNICKQLPLTSVRKLQ